MSQGRHFAKGVRQALDRLSIYLPVILMGLLAMGTWWLARSTPASNEPVAQRPLRHEPDYFMRGFSVRSFGPEGQLRSEVVGAELRHYPDTDTVEIDRPRIRAFNPQGILTTAQADRALSNGDGSEVQLFGNAVVVRAASGPGEPPVEVRSEFLHAFLREERVRTHKPVTLTRGAERYSADRLEADNLDRILQLDGRVRALLAPRQPRTAP